jgi:nicotinate-nucleotide adenylyltransferase
VSGGKYYPTVDLIKELKQTHPDVDFIFCMGTDLVEKFRSWEEGEYMAENQEFIIMSRVGYCPEEKFYPKKYRIVDTNLDGSSTKIRNRIREQIENRNKINLGINGLTTVSVINYILRNKLYQIKQN